jgi:hypothetical protein
MKQAGIWFLVGISESLRFNQGQSLHVHHVSWANTANLINKNALLLEPALPEQLWGSFNEYHRVSSCMYRQNEALN